MLDDMSRMVRMYPFIVASKYHAEACRSAAKCDIEWVPKVFGYRCSACGRITRATQGSVMNYCPVCGAENREQS